MLCFAAALAFAIQKSPLHPVVRCGMEGITRDGKTSVMFALKGTKVDADIAGFGARVTVVQTFTNPSDQPVEAVYTFPLSSSGAVDRMRMKIGDRVIQGVIKRREEARAIYESAKRQGQAAALLDQERPNVFTQSVANIMPKAEVRVEISYVELLKYEDNQFEFSFPMVVGPRFLGNAPDPSKISPPVSATRTGATIDLRVNLDAGAPVQAMKSVLHEVTVARKSDSQAVITLKKKDEIPNRDFVLKYRVATDSVQDAFLAHYDPVKGGAFALALMPPQAPTKLQIAPKEFIFVVDQSGSQNGFPIEKSKELTLKLIRHMHAGDTFNVMGFSNDVNRLWPAPQPATEATIAKAEAFVKALKANGGTQLRAAVQAALGEKEDPSRMRLVVFNTDGYVGNEAEILKSIREHRGHSRMFTFGIGNGVNRFLIDAMSFDGRGDSEVVTLAEDAEAAVARFVNRTENPVLTDVSVAFNGVEVLDQLPQAIPDVFGGKPIVVYGRYAAPGRGSITVSGRMSGKPWSKTIPVMFPGDKPGGEAVPALWARQMVNRLESENAVGDGAAAAPGSRNKLIDLALEYGIMTGYTSFVAVEQRVINVGGKQRTVSVPVEATSGVAMDRVEGMGAYSLSGGRGVSFQAASPAGFAGASRVRMGAVGGGGIPANNPVKKVTLTPAQKKAMEAQMGLAAFESKVAKGLRLKKGRLEVQVWLTAIDAETLAHLKAAGLHVDEQDKGLKLVFGTCDATALNALAKLKEVNRIEPIG